VSTRRTGALTGRTISRDTLSFLGGWGLMIYEAVRAQPFNTTVFLGGMVIAGIPGAVQAFTLFMSARTVLPPSESPEPASPGPSSS
jgi:hypothetical protein